MANENGSTNSVSAHTESGMTSAPPKARLKCPYMPRLTAIDRTPEMHSDATTG